MNGIKEKINCDSDSLSKEITLSGHGIGKRQFSMSFPIDTQADCVVHLFIMQIKPPF